MATTVAPISVYKTATNKVQVGGVAVTPIFGPVLGGYIVNPRFAADQGIGTVEELYVNIAGAAEIVDTTPALFSTTTILQPGQAFFLPPGLTNNVSVNAATSGHTFSGIVYQPQTPYPPAPQPGTFPPAGPTSLTQVIPSYLYQEYNDDVDLLAMVTAYHNYVQQYVDWFNNTNLPVYTGAPISGQLLDWVAQGLYGMLRPSLSSGQNRNLGPLNTYSYNILAYNARKIVGPQNIVFTSDDVFKRIMTWNFYKGDGNTFNVRWLKRRVMRFLIGPNGTAPNVDQTYIVSVTFGAGGIVSIRISLGTRTLTGGALYNRVGFNDKGLAYNTILSKFNPSPSAPPFASILKEAVASGAVELPFQYSFSVAV